MLHISLLVYTCPRLASSFSSPLPLIHRRELYKYFFDALDRLRLYHTYTPTSTSWKPTSSANKRPNLGAAPATTASRRQQTRDSLEARMERKTNSPSASARGSSLSSSACVRPSVVKCSL